MVPLRRWSSLHEPTRKQPNQRTPPGARASTYCKIDRVRTCISEHEARSNATERLPTLPGREANGAACARESWVRGRPHKLSLFAAALAMSSASRFSMPFHPRPSLRSDLFRVISFVIAFAPCTTKRWSGGVPYTDPNVSRVHASHATPRHPPHAAHATHAAHVPRAHHAPHVPPAPHAPRCPPPTSLAHTVSEMKFSSRRSSSKSLCVRSALAMASVPSLPSMFRSRRRWRSLEEGDSTRAASAAPATAGNLFPPRLRWVNWVADCRAVRSETAQSCVCAIAPGRANPQRRASDKSSSVSGRGRGLAHDGDPGARGGPLAAENMSASALAPDARSMIRER